MRNVLKNYSELDFVIIFVFPAARNKNAAEIAEFGTINTTKMSHKMLLN